MSQFMRRLSSFNIADSERGQLGGSYGGRAVGWRGGAFESLSCRRGTGDDSAFCRDRETKCLLLTDMLLMFYVWRCVLNAAVVASLMRARRGKTRRYLVYVRLQCSRKLPSISRLNLNTSSPFQRQRCTVRYNFETYTVAVWYIIPCALCS